MPALLLNAERPGWPLAGAARVKELCPQVMGAQTMGARDFHQLVVPDQVNAMIDRFLPSRSLHRRWRCKRSPPGQPRQPETHVMSE